MTLAPGELGHRAAQRLGRAPGALLLAGIGVASTLVLGTVLGVFARALERSVDRPFHDWLQQRNDLAFVQRQMLKLSVLADVPMTQVLAAIALVALACIYGRRAWIPVVVIGGAYVVERAVQGLLAGWIDRGHPPGTSGTFPSGGVLRVLVVHGATIACVLALLPLVERAARRVVWAGLLLVTLGVGVSRMWLGKHWLTDVVSAFPLGGVMVAFEIAIVGALTGPWTRAGSPRLT